MRLSIEDLASSLDLPASTVDRWIRQGRIPVRRSGGDCIFEVSSIERWASSKRLPLKLPEDRNEGPTEKTAQDQASLVQVMKRGGVYHDVSGDDVPAALTSAVSLIPNIADTDRQPLLQALLDRESLTSTGIGNGVAIPHPRAPLIETPLKPQISTCFLSQPVDYKAVDDRPVFVLFVLLSDSVQTHLHLLSRLAYGLRDKAFLDVLRQRPETPQLLEQIAAFEHRLDHASPL